MKPLHGLHNFGDALNGWLWPKLIPRIYEPDEEKMFIAIGSLLNAQWIPPRPARKICFGSGYCGGPKPAIDDNWQIYCVRGPLTAAAMGLESSLALTDPAILVAALSPATRPKQYKISYMPHEFSGRNSQWIMKADWAAALNRVGIHHLDPRAPVEITLKEIQDSELVITEAMHGAIVADALRVPWIPVRFYSHVKSFKWRDWCLTMQLPYEPSTIPLLDLRIFGSITVNRALNAHRRTRAELVARCLPGIARRRRGVLSGERTHRAMLTTTLERVHQLVQDHFPNH